jgi:hypothetical protein
MEAGEESIVVKKRHSGARGFYLPCTHAEALKGGFLAKTTFFQTKQLSLA